jgi:hypothetical protein
MPRRRVFRAMPSPIYAMQERDFERVMREAGTFFSWGDCPRIPCTFGATDNDYQIATDGGGDVLVYDLVLTTTRRQFPGGKLPSKGEEIEADGQKYQVSRPNYRPGSPLVKIYCSNLDAS